MSSNWQRTWKPRKGAMMRVIQGYPFFCQNFALFEGSGLMGHFRLGILENDIPNSKNFQLNLWILFTFQPVLVSVLLESLAPPHNSEFFCPTVVFKQNRTDPHFSIVLVKDMNFPRLVILRFIKIGYDQYIRRIMTTDPITLLIRHVFAEKTPRKMIHKNSVALLDQVYNRLKTVELFRDQMDLASKTNNDPDHKRHYQFSTADEKFQLGVPDFIITQKSEMVKMMDAYAVVDPGVFCEGPVDPKKQRSLVVPGILCQESLNVLKDYFYIRHISPSSIQFLLLNPDELSGLVHFANFYQITGLFRWMMGIVHFTVVELCNTRAFMTLYATIVRMPGNDFVFNLMHPYLVSHFRPETSPWQKFKDDYPDLFTVIENEFNSSPTWGDMCYDKQQIHDYLPRKLRRSVSFDSSSSSSNSDSGDGDEIG